jgi:hypothetical protein
MMSAKQEAALDTNSDSRNILVAVEGVQGCIDLPKVK